VLALAGAQAQVPAAGRSPARGDFLVAFELAPGRTSDVVWPHRMLPAFPGRRVLLVVDRMPWASSAGSASPRPLRPQDALRVNGRPPRAPATASLASAEFLVDLDGGRLHVRLAPPAGCRLEAGHERAAITLYRVESGSESRRER
jgi:hypothetical protein